MASYFTVTPRPAWKRNPAVSTYGGVLRGYSCPTNYGQTPYLHHI